MQIMLLKDKVLMLGLGSLARLLVTLGTSSAVHAKIFA